MSCCRLETERLLLRPPERRDIPALVPLIGDFEVSKNLGNVPHPYAENDATAWLSTLDERRAKGEVFSFAITRKCDGAYLGGCGLHLENGALELGYWLGKPYWRFGFATEAARRVLDFAFDELQIPTVWAGWFHDNPKSGHVLAKLGFAATRFEKRACLSRGTEIGCNIVTLSREAFVRRLAS